MNPYIAHGARVLYTGLVGSNTAWGIHDCSLFLLSLRNLTMQGTGCVTCDRNIYCLKISCESEFISDLNP